MAYDPLLPTKTPEDLMAVVRELSTIDQRDLADVPESVFKQRLLPLLAEPSNGKTDLTIWMDLAGSPQRGLRIINDITGEELFRTPPLMRTLKPDSQEGLNMNQLVHEAKMRMDVHPASGQAFLAQQLSKVRHDSTLYDIESAKTWNAIRVRYGYQPLPIGKAGALVGQLTAGADSAPTSDTLAKTSSVTALVAGEDEESFF